MGKQKRHNPSKDTISDGKLVELVGAGWSNWRISKTYHIDIKAIKDRLNNIKICRCGECAYIKFGGDWLCTGCLNPELPITDDDRMAAVYTGSNSASATAIDEDAFSENELKNLKSKMLKAIKKIETECNAPKFDTRPYYFNNKKTEEKTA